QEPFPAQFVFFQPSKKDHHAVRSRENMDHFCGIPPDSRPLNRLSHGNGLREPARIGDNMNEFGKNLRRQRESVPRSQQRMETGTGLFMIFVRTDFDCHKERSVETMRQFNISPKMSSRLVSGRRVLPRLSGLSVITLVRGRIRSLRNTSIASRINSAAVRSVLRAYSTKS